MIPFTESRASIPIALELYKFSPGEVILWATLGSFIPGIIIVFFMDPLYAFVMRYASWSEPFFQWVFKRTRSKFSKQRELKGALALAAFVAIPLPGTGVWTGSLAGWLFGLKKRDTLISVGLGALVDAVLVTLIAIGIISIF